MKNNIYVKKEDVYTLCISVLIFVLCLGVFAGLIFGLIRFDEDISLIRENYCKEVRSLNYWSYDEISYDCPKELYFTEGIYVLMFWLGLFFEALFTFYTIYRFVRIGIDGYKLIDY